MKTQYTATVIGDVNVELSCSLDGLAFPLIDHDTLIYRDIACSVSGSAYNFAELGLAYFREMHLLCKVGADAFGDLITRHLIESDIQGHCSIASHLPTGASIFVRDASETNPKGTRLLIIQSDSANTALDIEDVERCRSVVANTDLLMVDGYNFLSQPRRDASLHAMRIARSGGAVIAFDLVPHDPAKLPYGLATLHSYMETVDVILTEVGTIRHLMGKDIPEEVITVDTTLDTWRFLQAEFPGTIFYLLFGIGNCDQSLLCGPEMVPQHAFTGYRDAPQQDLPKFGEAFATRALAELLPLLR